MTRRRSARALTAVPVAAAVALLSGCGVTAEPQARPLTSADAPLGLLHRTSPSPQPPGPAAERLLFVRDSLLVPVLRSTQRAGAQAALADLLAGPSATDRATGITTALPQRSDPPPVQVRDGVAVVVVGEDLLDAGRSDQVLALAQVVLTLDSVAGIDAVRFTRDGQPLPVPRGDGSLTPAPVTARDYADLVAP